MKLKDQVDLLLCKHKENKQWLAEKMRDILLYSTGETFYYSKLQKALKENDRRYKPAIEEAFDDTLPTKPIDLRARFDHFRDKKGLSLQDIADKMFEESGDKMSRQAVHKMFYCKRIGRLDEILEILDVTPNEFFS